MTLLNAPRSVEILNWRFFSAKGQLANGPDARIAALCSARNLIPAAANTREFNRAAGLVSEDWLTAEGGPS